jgi:hypothetical protein
MGIFLEYNVGMTAVTRKLQHTKTQAKSKAKQDDWDLRIERAFGILSPEQGEQAVKHLEHMRGRTVNFEKTDRNSK